VNAPVMSPFWSRYAHHEARKLDLEVMQKAAESFLGKHDWTAFCAAQSDVEDRVRTITHLEITERTDERSRSTLVEIRVSADGFLRYMVRAISGTLLSIGRGELNSDAVQKAIAAGVRPTVAATAPACGLTLLSVRYSENTD
jgi:tRNA pseudouridine38-40 synthase